MHEHTIMKILIATDGSDFSKAAIEEACRIFSGIDSAEIKLISVYEEVYPMAAAPVAIGADYYKQLMDAAIEQAGQFIDQGSDLINNLIPGGGKSLKTQVLKGSPAREIVSCAEEWGADVIVVGSHGYGFWSRALVGSVSDSVIHHAPCSVLVVRDRSGG